MIYATTWLNTITGAKSSGPDFTGGWISSPTFYQDIALLLSKKNSY